MSAYSSPIRRILYRFLACALILAIALISLLPSERLMLESLSWVITHGGTTGAYDGDDRTFATPAPKAPSQKKTDFIAAGGSASARGGGAGSAWSTRSHALQLPPMLGKTLISIRDAVDAARAAALALASDHRLDSEARIAAPVTTTVQFLC